MCSRVELRLVLELRAAEIPPAIEIARSDRSVEMVLRPCPNREIDPPGGRRYRYREATGMLLIG